MVASMKMPVFWDVALGSLVDDILQVLTDSIIKAFL
jgi:hypothetical protein